MRPSLRLRLTFALLPLLAVPAAAQAQDCANFENLDQSSMNQCAYRDWEIADANLNDAYKAAMALLKEWDTYLPASEKGGAQALKEAQRAWITFRDKACEAEGYAMKGGSAEPLLVYGCMRQLSDERANHLWALVETYR